MERWNADDVKLINAGRYPVQMEKYSANKAIISC
jgi:hypothetical protein